MRFQLRAQQHDHGVPRHNNDCPTPEPELSPATLLCISDYNCILLHMSDPLPEVIPPFFDDDLPVDRRKCRLLGPTALVVQALMGVFVILSLVYKRHRESPKRPWRIWTFDVSKQVVGQMFIHGMNLLISGVGAHHASSNPCALYFLNILIDTTLGVALIYFIHHFLTYVFSDKLMLKGFRSGQYGSPPSILYWIRQAVVYVTALTTMKLVVISLFAVWPGIVQVGNWLLSWTGGGDGIQVIFVMGLFPIAMNVLQFWLIDSIVKAASQDSELLPSSSPRHSADREPLVDSNRSNDDDDDDDDDGDASIHGHGAENAPFIGSSSQSLGSKDAVEEEQKYLSSRTSTNEPEGPDESPTNSPLSSPRNDESRHSFTVRPASPTSHRRRIAPRVPPESQRYKASETRILASPGTPVTSQKARQSAGIVQIELRTLHEKLSNRDERGDWTFS
ncbi:hypothetical protein ACEPAG_6515 [Sanghuangporus baumii]